MKTSKFLLISSVIVLIALSIVPVISAGAVGGLAAASPAVVTKTVPAAQQAAALSAWTHAAMAAAKPLDAMVDFGSPKAQVPALGGFALPAATGFKAAGAAAPDANAIARQAFPADWSAASTAAASSPADEFAGTAQVYTSYTINAWLPAQTIYPHKWIGRLYFKTGPTSAAFCSATALTNNTFVTAAHCVYDTTNNVWYSGWVFTPAYRAGSAPYGSFAATACTLLTAWINLSGSFSISSWTQYDVAVCSAGVNAAQQTLNFAVGWAGQQWNWGYVRSVYNMGYPFNNYNNVAISGAGAYLRTCAGETAQYVADVLRVGCNWGPGISGGPWMVGYAQAAIAGYVNSVNSGLFIGEQDLYGIRFTDYNFRAICAVRGC